MSEENKTVHIKHPGRVEGGKRSAAMRKLTKLSEDQKEKKRNGDKEIKLIKKDIKIDTDTESKLNSYRIEVLIGIGGLLVAVGALYLQYKNSVKVQQAQVIPQQSINPYPLNYNNF